MSIDPSLKTPGGLVRHRNVLTRQERLEHLADIDAWDEEKDSVFGLPKVANYKSAVGKKKAPKEEEAKAE